MDIYLNGCNNSGHKKSCRWVLMSQVFILQESGEMKSTVVVVVVVVVCLLVLFICSSRCGVAAATLLAKDDPIKRSFQTEQMCA